MIFLGVAGQGLWSETSDYHILIHILGRLNGVGEMTKPILQHFIAFGRCPEVEEPKPHRETANDLGGPDLIRGPEARHPRMVGHERETLRTK